MDDRMCSFGKIINGECSTTRPEAFYRYLTFYPSIVTFDIAEHSTIRFRRKRQDSDYILYVLTLDTRGPPIEASTDNEVGRYLPADNRFANR